MEYTVRINLRTLRYDEYGILYFGLMVINWFTCHHVVCHVNHRPVPFTLHVRRVDPLEKEALHITYRNGLST